MRKRLLLLAAVGICSSLFAQGGHGYGLRRTAFPVTAWPRSVETWLRTIQVLPPSAP